MARIKIPGVYMIRNKTNGKVYIGESKDIRTRWSKYRWGATTTFNYHETARPITQALRHEGIDNFEFIILASGDVFTDINLRLSLEAQYIAQYKSDNPEFGYNISSGFEHFRSADGNSREQSFIEKIKRAKPIIQYDIETGAMMLYLGGAKSWGDDHGYCKDVSSHTVKRGSLIEGRYYLIYAEPERRHKQLEIIRNKKMSSDRTGRSAVRTANTFHKYEDAVNIVDNCDWFQ